MALRLGRYPRFESRDADEARLAYSHAVRHLRLEIESPGFEMVAHSAMLSTFTLETIAVGSPRRVYLEADDRFYIACLWRRGANVYRMQGRQFDLDSGQGLLLAPDVEIHSRESGDQDLTVVRIPAGWLHGFAALMIGRPNEKPLSVEATGVIEQDSAFWRKTEECIQALDHEGGSFLLPFTSCMQTALARELIFSTATNYREWAWKEEASNPAQRLRRCLALEGFMLASLRLPFPTLMEPLMKIAGVTWRTIERDFKEHRHKPVLHVFREMQMDEAKRAFETEPGAAISVIAYRYAIRPDHFREWYVWRHGESPEETLAKSHP